MKWIKMFPEMLHDRKMWKLKPMEQLTFIYLCLLAGAEDRGGELPPIEDIELELRLLTNMKTSDLVRTIDTLKSHGMITEVRTGVLTVTNFEKRQMSGLTEAERKAQYRDKKRTQSGQMSQECPDTCPDTVPEMSRPDIDIDIDIEEDIDKENKDVNGNKEILKERVNTPTPKKPAAQKHQYGSFKNVLLTDAELEKLHERFPDADERIEYFSKRKAAKGYNYKSDYAALLSWAEDKTETRAKVTIPQAPRKYSATEVVEMMERGELVV